MHVQFAACNHFYVRTRKHTQIYVDVYKVSEIAETVCDEDAADLGTAKRGHG